MYTKKNTVREFADKYGYTYKSISVLYDQIVEFISDTLIEGGGIFIYGIGTLETKMTNEKTLYDLNKRAMTTFPPNARPSFFFTEGFRNKVAQAYHSRLLKETSIESESEAKTE